MTRALHIATILAAVVGVSATSAAAQEDCPAYDTRGWHAWIDKGGEGGSARLLIHGQMDMPSPGFTASWKLGPLDRMAPPNLRLNVSFSPPDGMSAQVITAQDVMFVTPAMAADYGSIIISCGTRDVTVITDIARID